MAHSRYRAYRAVHPFDERLGVDTGDLIYDLPPGGDSRDSNNGYCAMAPSVFHPSIQRLGLDCSRFTFIDLGSGKGRALLLAAEYPFRQIIGVEISARLHRTALRNIRKFRASSSAGVPGASGVSITATQADAAGFAFPKGPLLVYMWNAFTEPVLARVLENLYASFRDEPREIYLLYIDPDLEMRLHVLPWIKRIWSMEIALSEEDYDAWPFPDHTENCSAYQLVAPPDGVERR